MSKERQKSRGRQNMSPSISDTVEECLDRIRLAWNAGDARAYAKEFTDDATYIIYLGELLQGRDEIETGHVPVLTKWQRGSKMAVKVLSLRQIDSNTISALTIGSLGKSDVIPFDKMQTFTFVCTNGRWLCSAFHNTKMSRRARRLYNAGSNTGASRFWQRWFGQEKSSDSTIQKDSVAMSNGVNGK
jgi:uncharacterized protein (TIGR02246 family)